MYTTGVKRTCKRLMSMESADGKEKAEGKKSTTVQICLTLSASLAPVKLSFTFNSFSKILPGISLLSSQIQWVTMECVTWKFPLFHCTGHYKHKTGNKTAGANVVVYLANSLPEVPASHLGAASYPILMSQLLFQFTHNCLQKQQRMIQGLWPLNPSGDLKVTPGYQLWNSPAMAVLPLEDERTPSVTDLQANKYLKRNEGGNKMVHEKAV